MASTYTYATDISLSSLGPETGPSGNDIVSFQTIDPPDDRYIPGYSITQADGDVKTVGPRLKDLNIPFSLYGLPIPITFGVRRLYGNLIWAVPLKETVKKSKSGGKGGGPTEKTVEYQYFATFAVAFGYSGFDSVGSRDVLRIWGDGSLIYDRRSLGETKIEGLHFKFYPGSTTQGADPTIESYEGVGAVPGYRDLMYVVFVDVPVANFGNRPPAISIEVGDATTAAYSVTNIYPDAIDGSRSQDEVIPSFNIGYVFTIRGGAGGTAVVRAYDLSSNTVASYAYGNLAGIGWDNNAGDVLEANLTESKGIQTSNTTPGYIPWINKIIMAANTGAGKQVVGLMDPLTGVVGSWCGGDAGESGTTLAYSVYAALSTDDNPYPQGNIPLPEFYAAQLVYAFPAPSIYIAGATLYGDTFVLQYNLFTEIMELVFTDGQDLDQIIPGTQDVASGCFFGVKNDRVYKLTVDSGATLVRVGTTYTPVGFDLSEFLNMGDNVNNILYYEPEDALIVFLDDGNVHKYDATTGDEIYNVTIDNTKLPTPLRANIHLCDLSGGFFAWNIAGSTVYEFDIAFGTFTEYPVTNGHFLVNEQTFDSRTKSLIGIGYAGGGSAGTGQANSMAAALSRGYYDRLGDDRIALADFLEAMAIYAGYDVSEIEVDTDITEEIDGAIITQVTSFRTIVDPVCTVYRIDIVESDGKIKFLKKPEAYTGTDFTIPSTDLLFNDNDSFESATFQLRREEEVAIPERVSIRYMDKTLGYNFAVQFATRSQFVETNQSNTQITYELPIIMTASEAKKLAQRALWTAWLSRVSYSFRVGPKHLKIEPADVGNVTAGGLTYKIKAIEVTYNNDFSIGIKGTSFASDEAITVVADPGTGYTQEISSAVGAEVYILDIPLIYGSQDMNALNQFPLYIHVSPIKPTSTWIGGSAFFSFNFTTFEEIVSNVVEGCVMVTEGVLTASNSLDQIDTVNTVSVRVKQGDVANLVTVTEEELLDGSNLAAYGVNGRWELIQFKTVTDNGDGSYTLSDILRARAGTDYNVDNHRVGDVIVLLSNATVDLTSLTFSQVEASFAYKGVGFKQNEQTQIPFIVTMNGYGALPWPPCNIRITRSIAGDGDLTISWNRRTRLHNHLIDEVENSALGATELNDYRITIWRWPHYDNWTYGGGTWSPGANDPDNDTLVIDVTGAETYALGDAAIRAGELYEFSAPDDLMDSMSTFSQVGGAYITANEAENEQMVDLGYSEFMAFKYLDIMIQQKTTVPNSTGYGPGRRTRVLIEDT